MLYSLRWRLTAAFLFVSLLGLAVVALLTRTVTVNEFDRLRAQEATAEFDAWAVSYYTANGTFEGFDAYVRTLRPAMPPPGTQNQPPPAGGGQGQQGQPPSGSAQQGGMAGNQPRGRYLLVGLDGIALTNASPFRTGDAVDADFIARGYPVEVDGVRVGTLVDTDDLPELDPRQQAFIQRTDQALLIASGVAGVIALIAGAVLARGLANPLTRLTSALTVVGQDVVPVSIESKARGEIGTLVNAFNRMSADLARSNHLRRQMTADIAHELRSPLAVINGYLEGMRDGTLPPTKERYDVIYEETQQLRHLIDDLRTLSLADAGELSLRFEHANPLDLLSDALRSFAVKAEQHGVTLKVDAPPDLPAVKVDRARMMQVLSNLLHNALRYTPERGTITLEANAQGEAVELRVRDTGKGIAPDKLPNLFQRFYRVESDRDQEEGQTGIGLAIVKALVEQHGGSVRAESAGVGHGSAFSVRLPATS